MDDLICQVECAPVDDPVFLSVFCALGDFLVEVVGDPDQLAPIEEVVVEMGSFGEPVFGEEFLDDVVHFVEKLAVGAGFLLFLDEGLQGIQQAVDAGLQDYQVVGRHLRTFALTLVLHQAVDGDLRGQGGSDFRQQSLQHHQKVPHDRHFLIDERIGTVLEQ